MTSVSVLSPERRIELNPYDVDAWNLLLRESQARSIDQARSFYEKLVGQFHNAGRYWKAYIEHEIRAKNFENVEALFARCLVSVLNIDLWKCYIHYVHQTKGHLPSFREKMAHAFDFALDKMGLDMHALSIYADYITFLKNVPAVGQYAENQRTSAIRKIYQRGIATPLLGIENLWNDYCAFEKGVNQALAEKLITEKNKDYQVAKRVARSLEQKSNPLNTEEYGQLAKRVIFAYEQALLCMAASGTITSGEGDVKLSAAMTAEIIQLYDRAISDYQEERRNYEHVKKIYGRLLDNANVDPTLPYIQLIKFTRRTEGVEAARLVFKQAREDKRISFHVYVAAATMEYYCSKNKQVAMRIFDLGLKRFSNDSEYALSYVDFLSHLNEDNNTRVIFERILNSGALSSDKAVEIWDKYLEFESQVGDLTSILKVDKRRREAVKDIFEERQALLLIDRYKFLNLAPCTTEQLKFMGYSKQARFVSSNPGMSGSHPSSSNGASYNVRNELSGTAVKQSTSANQGNILDVSSFPRPDTNQMLPFKPKLLPAAGSQHPVPGGIFPPPPAVAQLLQLLPPPWTFVGPFPEIDKLLESLARFNREIPKTNVKEELDPSASFGGYKAADVKKELYQLVSTTTDPAAVLASHEYQQSMNNQKKRLGGRNDSDSDDESSRHISTSDIYKKRQRLNMRGD
uniref:Suppressor of forked domain-containing protein n=1 Tax=Ditylenchus dipsaci TaxID=166011 RepID=A0A915DS50_9BILA